MSLSDPNKENEENKGFTPSPIYTPPSTQSHSSDYTEKIEPSSPPKWPRYVLLLGFICSVLLVFVRYDEISSKGGDAYRFGSIIGTMLSPWLCSAVVGFLAALILLIFKKPFAKSFRGTFVVLVGVFSVLMLAGNMMNQSRSAKQRDSRVSQEDALDEMQQNAMEMQEQMFDEDGIPIKTEKRFRVPKNPQTIEEVGIAVTNSYYNDMMDLQNDYLEDIEKAGIELLLDPSRIKEDTDFSESYAMADALEAIVDKYKVRVLKLVNGYPERAMKYNIPSSQKNEFVKTVRAGLPRMRHAADKNWTYEKQAMGHMRNILKAWDEADGKWKIDAASEFIVFDLEKDEEAFAVAYSGLMDCLRKQEEYRIRVQQDMMKKMGQIKSDLN